MIAANTSAATYVLCAALLFGPFAGSAISQESKLSKVERGKYLVTIGGCHDCHSPKTFTPEGIPVPDETRLLSGHPAGETLPDFRAESVAPGRWVLFNNGFTAAVGPWGVTYAANLTPDDQTGIGLWTEEVFVNALRTGKHMGAGRPILPPMPWPNLKDAREEDLSAIFAYFKSLPAVKNAVPAPVSAKEMASQ